MRTKLLGAFIAALSIAAFAALPSAASAANVTLKEGALTVPVNTTIRAHSTNVTFTGRPSGLKVACARTAIRGKVRTNPGSRITFRPGGRFLNAQGGDQCEVPGTNGRITARVENVTFRKDITLGKTGTKTEGRTEARFTFRFFDKGVQFRSCSYDGKIEARGVVGTDQFDIKSEGDAEIEASISDPECDPEGFIEGTFRVSRRTGGAVTTN